MPANAFIGQVPLAVGGREVHLRITWATCAALCQAVGPDWERKIFDLPEAVMREPDGARRFAEVIVLMSDPDDALTADDLIAASPPLEHVAEAMHMAVNLFLRGHPGLSEDEAGAEQEGGEKKGRPLPPKSSWSSAGAALWKRVCRNASSGLKPSGKPSTG